MGRQNVGRSGETGPHAAGGQAKVRVAEVQEGPAAPVGPILQRG